jgi:hypothetical protein
MISLGRLLLALSTERISSVDSHRQFLRMRHHAMICVLLLAQTALLRATAMQYGTATQISRNGASRSSNVRKAICSPVVASFNFLLLIAIHCITNRVTLNAVAIHYSVLRPRAVGMFVWSVVGYGFEILFMRRDSSMGMDATFSMSKRRFSELR